MEKNTKKNKLTVLKADGTLEPYLHTKVLATINSALDAAGHTDIYVAEQLTDVITYFLHEEKENRVSSVDILSMIKAVLVSTNFEAAADALHSYQIDRGLQRSRIEVVHAKRSAKADPHALARSVAIAPRSVWNKTKIVEYVMKNCELERATARVVASLVEQKVLAMQVRHVPASLVRELVHAEVGSVIHSQLQFA